MTTSDTDVQNLIINVLSQQDFEGITTPSNTELYFVTDDTAYELTENKVSALSGSSTNSQYPSAKCVYDELATKQATLVSGTNIKTINSTSLLGNGDISIPSYTFSTGLTESSGTITVTDYNKLLKNSATGANTVGVGGASSAMRAVYFGDALTKAEGIYSIAIGPTATTSTNGQYAIAIGPSASSTSTQAYQIGPGTNSTGYSLAIGFNIGGTAKEYTLLSGSTGLIPLDRISEMSGADGTNAGIKGLVPAPAATDDTKFLKGDGTWATVGTLPSMTGNAGKLLSTDGTTASWQTTEVIYPVIETYSNGADWYRIYSDGWCEQGGIATRTSTNPIAITFLKTYSSVNYTVYVQTQAADNYTNNSYTYSPYITNKSTTGFNAVQSSPAVTNIGYFVWGARGYVASGT